MRPDKLRFELVPEATAETPPESPLRLVHRALRGRYRYAALLAVVFAAVGSLTGYNLVPPKYASTGLVHLEAALPTILYATEESRTPPEFDAYVAQQTAYLQSSHLLAAAVKSPEMVAEGWPSGPQGVSMLSRALTVARGRGEHTISVTVTHRDPRLTQTAVNAILAAYTESAPDPGGVSLAVKERVLVKRERDLEGQLQTMRLQMLDASDQYGADAVQRMHAGKVDELMEVDQKLEQIRLTRRNVEAGAPLDGAASLGAVPGDDAQLTRLKNQELALRAEMESLQYRPSHPIMRDLQRKLDAVRIQMQLRRQTQDEIAAGDAAAGDPDAAVLAHLDRLEAGYVAMREKLGAEAADLGRRRIVLSGLGEKVAGIQERLQTTRRRLDEVRFEASRGNGDRLSIVAGGLPGLPTKDRRAGLAGAGAMGGVCGGIAIMALIGLRDRRLRYIDELEAMMLPIAIMPADAQRLRQTLQLRRCNAPGSGLGSIHAVAGCEPDAGGDALAHALAISFAGAGYRTLLVDADLESARLSRVLGLDTRPGLREGIATGHGGGSTHATAREGLWAMPAGSLETLTPRDLHRESIRRLYADLRPKFDAIVINAGVVRAGFDACLVTAEADEVVVQVDHGQQRESVRATVAQIRLLGAAEPSLVFGRTPVPDIRHAGGPAPRDGSPVVGVIGDMQRKHAA